MKVKIDDEFIAENLAMSFFDTVYYLFLVDEKTYLKVCLGQKIHNISLVGYKVLSGKASS